MVGFEVMPRTPFCTRSANLPSCSQSRRRLSNHGLWPAMSYRSWSRVILLAPFPGCGEVLGPASLRLRPGGQQGPGPGHHMVDGETEFLHVHPAGGRGPEPVEAHGSVGVATP